MQIKIVRYFIDLIPVFPPGVHLHLTEAESALTLLNEVSFLSPSGCFWIPLHQAVCEWGCRARINFCDHPKIASPEMVPLGA